MARIRTIKPEFWEDERVASLSPLARLLFIGTWNLADDEGILRWSVDYLNASLFMYDGLSAKRVRALMQELEPGLVFPYAAGASRQALGYVVNFRKHQKINRPQPGKFPPPSLQSAEAQEMYGERDDWTCHLCKGDINREAVRILDPYNAAETRAKPSPDLNLSLDHLTPRSKGGGDYPSNIRAAHIGCNKARGDRPISAFTVPDSVSRSLSDSVNGAGSIHGGKGSGIREEDQGRDHSPESRSASSSSLPVLGDDDEVKLRREAQVRLDRRVAEKGPVGDPDAWLATCIGRLRSERLMSTAQRERIDHCADCAGQGVVELDDGTYRQCFHDRVSA